MIFGRMSERLEAGQMRFLRHLFGVNRTRNKTNTDISNKMFQTLSKKLKTSKRTAYKSHIH
jgi:hypothetical protein